jgi:hypothetical protein
LVFLLSRRCRHPVRRSYIVKFPHPMYFSLRRAKERSIRTRPSLFSPTKGKIHGVWKFNNITPSHLSHPVDTFSALPSMAVGWCLYHLLRRKTPKNFSRTHRRWPCAYATLFSPTKGKIHGVWKFNNITPSHLSHPVDTFSALLSMAKRQFGVGQNC